MYILITPHTEVLHFSEENSNPKNANIFVLQICKIVLMFSRSGNEQRKQLEEKEQILIQASLLFEHEAVAQSKNAIFSARTDLELPNSSVIRQIHSRGTVPEDVMNLMKETDTRFDAWFRPCNRNLQPGEQQRRRLRKLETGTGASEYDRERIESWHRALLDAGDTADISDLLDCALLLSAVAM